MSQRSEDTAAFPAVTIGLDLGDRLSQLYAIDAAGRRVDERQLPTTRAAFTTYCQDRPRGRVVMEVGTHSPWIARLLTALEYEVHVANPSAMYGQGRRRRRNDRSDAEYLARGRGGPT